MRRSRTGLARGRFEKTDAYMRKIGIAREQKSGFCNLVSISVTNQKRNKISSVIYSHMYLKPPANQLTNFFFFNNNLEGMRTFRAKVLLKINTMSFIL